MKDLLLALDLQFFSDEGGEADEPEKEELEKVEKVFTQQDVNDMIAEETKLAQEKLLEQAGVTDFADLKEGMAKFKEWQESQKTEAQKQAEALESANAKFTQLQQEYTTLQEKMAAVSADIKEESINDALLLARAYVNEETDINAALKLVKEKYPQFGKEEQQQELPLYGLQPRQQQAQKDDVWAGIYNKWDNFKK